MVPPQPRLPRAGEGAGCTDERHGLQHNYEYGLSCEQLGDLELLLRNGAVVGGLAFVVLDGPAGASGHQQRDTARLLCLPGIMQRCPAIAGLGVEPGMQ